LSADCENLLDRAVDPQQPNSTLLLHGLHGLETPLAAALNIREKRSRGSTDQLSGREKWLPKNVFV
jgi:hypothetical protein